jgi:hypothetical protein
MELSFLAPISVYFGQNKNQKMRDILQLCCENLSQQQCWRLCQKAKGGGEERKLFKKEVS